MQISLLVGFWIPLLLAPYWTSQLVARAQNWEATQIAVDNAAIIIGRADRELFRYLQSSNRVLRALETVHDPLHLCARSPVGETCVAQDFALERQIELLHGAVFASAEAMWRASGQAGLAYLREKGVRLEVWRRHANVPIFAKRCKVCGLLWAWEILPESSARDTWIRAKHEVPIGVGVRAEGESLLGGEKWNYRLAPLVAE